MEIVFLTPPGRLPSVVHDPGPAWEAASSFPDHRASRYSANHSWWNAVCSPGFLELLEPGGAALSRAAAAAGDALRAFQEPATFSTAARYGRTVARLSAYLDRLNRAQGELLFSLESGAVVPGLDLYESRALADYAERTSLLSRTIDLALAGAPPRIDLLMVKVTYPRDLLTAMIATRLLKERRPALHACLEDHGYENFALHAHLPRLRKAGTLERFFDTVIVSQDDRGPSTRAVIESIERKNPLKGFLEPRPASGSPPGRPRPLASLPVFAPRPVLWTRVSERRCYWSRCTFCTQNSKYDDPRPAGRLEIARDVERIRGLERAGFRTFIFSDEALSPAFLHDFADGLLKAGARIQWSCRCRLDHGFDRELFDKMARAGCYEILFGLESVSPRMLKLMDKHPQGLDLGAVRAAWSAMADAAIGIHVTMIGGFPGDTPDDVQATVDFFVDAVRGLPNVTFKLNRFELFPETPAFEKAASFGITVLPPRGDMPYAYRYLLDPALEPGNRAVDGMVDALEGDLYRRLGWGPRKKTREGKDLLYLYFHSGHGSILKSSGRNPLASPLHRIRLKVRPRRDTKVQAHVNSRTLKTT